MSFHPEETCWTVLRDASRGDEEARSTFARSYFVPVRAYLAARWLHHPLAAEVDDASQDVLVECLKPTGVLQRADPERGDFRGLLYGVVTNVARRYEERAAARRRRHEDSNSCLGDLPDREESLSRTFDRSWARSLLREALCQYACSTRGDEEGRRRYRILRWRHEHGLPIREIAKRLGEPDTDRVHGEYRHARRAFSSALRDVVATRVGVRGEAIEIECRRLIELLAS